MSEQDCQLVNSSELSNEANVTSSSVSPNEETKTIATNKSITVQAAELDNEVSVDEQVSQSASNEPNSENFSSSSSSSDQVASTRESTVQTGAGIKIQVNNQDYDESSESATTKGGEDNSVGASSSSSENLFLQQNTNSSEIVRSVFSSANKTSSTTPPLVSTNPFSCVRNTATSSFSAGEAETQPQPRSSVIVTPSRLFGSGHAPFSPSTSSTTARGFSSFSPRHDSNGSSEASNGDVSTKSKPSFFLVKSRLESLASNGGEKNSNECSNNNLKIKLRPSVLKVGESSNSEQSNNNGNATAQVTTSGEPDSSSKKNISVMDVGLIKFTPLTNVTAVYKDNKPTTSARTTKSTEVCTSNGSNHESSQTPSSTTIVAPSSSSATPVSSFNTFAIASSSTGNADGFVFGQNLEERVTNVSKKEDKTEDKTAVEPTAVISEKRKYENITGEEDESNVKQIYCKLFQWDSATSGWKEKGRGNLRLNDKKVDGKSSSRLIMRTSGSLKLILNCMIVHGMKFEQSSDTLRFSTVDGVHIIRGKSKDVEELKLAVDNRLRNLPKRVRADEDGRDGEDDEDHEDEEGEEENQQQQRQQVETTNSVSVETINSTKVQN